MDIKTGGPAFPTYAGADWDKDPLDPYKDDPRNKILGGGMTMRDWFAGQALVWAGHEGWLTRDHENMAKRAYRMADAMIAARSAQ